MSKKQQNEKAIFDLFEKRFSNFAGRPVTTILGNDPPDILCTDAAGARIGVELGEWVNEIQIAIGKTKEGVERSFSRVIKSDEELPPEHIGISWIGLKEEKPLKGADAGAFRKEIYEVVEESDKRWPTNGEVNGPQGYTHSDFSKYPIVARYVKSIHFHPRTFARRKGGDWLTFPMPGGTYSPKTAVDALESLYKKKAAKYGDLHLKENLGELYLVAYYNQGLFYNSPYETPYFDFEDVAAVFKQWVGANPGRFQKVFLFDATGEGKVAQIL
jgi:hypothetical protein